uniref:tRNA dimethylallyltransferase n=1 Tax=candidate division CPR3 bacterium TaxID=2268181 RepID=A0A7C4R4Q2_UNCC3
MSIKKINFKPKIIVVCGPTGSGKTGLANYLCQKFDGEIINVDSRQVYREMNIGTGKDLDQIKVPIHLVDIINPDEKYNVGQFKIDAEEVIRDIISRGKVPFIVGGTGLYVDALTENFSFPSISNLKSKKLKINIKSKNLEELVNILGKLDPEALSVVDLKNRRRVERAIEVCLTTGIPFTKQRNRGERNYEVLKLSPAVSLDREKLYEKINKRVDEMVDEGLEKEVRSLVEKYGWESEAMTGIGYREWRLRHSIPNFQFPISNKTSSSKIQNKQIINDVIEEIKKNTRNYAKRQMTWFKRDKEINYVDLKKAEKLVRCFLIN